MRSGPLLETWSPRVYLGPRTHGKVSLLVSPSVYDSLHTAERRKGWTATLASLGTELDELTFLLGLGWMADQGCDAVP